ncbi:MAG TPA: hypothetical protein ENJ95_21600 [Bacteroidetes bacterium]|nr:hypothetical protein [Bacteroidota bacterium]
MSAAPYPIKTEDELVFSFVSEGPRGRIKKVVKYQEFSPGYFNLAFGDQVQNGGSTAIDDKASSDNGDMKKVLATVISTLELFFEKRPECAVLFKGSTPGRTLLYHRIIKNYRHLFGEALYIYGGTEEILIQTFFPEKEYQFFWVAKFPLI